MKAVEKWLKPGYIIILVLGLILISLLFNNLDNIVGKFGFETKADLRAELTHVKNHVVDLESRNENLTYVVETEKKICLIREDIIEYVSDQHIDIDNVVANALKGLVIPVLEDIPVKEVSEGTEVIVKEEVASYASMVDVYATLFGDVV